MNFHNLITSLKSETSYDSLAAKKIIFSLSSKVKNETDLIIHRNELIDFNYKDFLKMYSAVTSKRVPIEYVLKKISFCKYEFLIEKKVFLPRVETEQMIWDLLNDQSFQPKNILDLCSGSGIPTCAFKIYRNQAQVTGVEKKKSSIKIANENAKILSIIVKFVHCDVFKFLTKNNLQEYDFVFFNPPYIPMETKLDESLRHDNQSALKAKDEGFFFYQKFFTNHFRKFSSNTKFLIEIDVTHVERVEKLFYEIGIKNFKIIKDIYDFNRFILINF